MNDYNQWSKEVVNELKKRPFLKWQTKKNNRLSKRLFKEGYTVQQAVSMIILNS